MTPESAIRLHELRRGVRGLRHHLRARRRGVSGVHGVCGDHGVVADLLTRPLLRRDEPAWGSRVPWLAASVAAGWALIAGFAMSVLPGVAVWLSEGASQPLSDPPRCGARVWLAAHRIGLDVDGAGFTIAPLGLTIAFVLLLHRSARGAAHSA